MFDNEHMTLREAISDFYRDNKTLYTKPETSDKAKQFFRCHDTAHVIFACDTTIRGEGIVKIWTIFGTSLGFWKHLSSYSEAGAFALFTKYGWNSLRTSSKGLFTSLPTAIRNARKMNKRWPWSDHEQFLDKTLYEIRKEFNIEIVKND